MVHISLEPEIIKGHGIGKYRGVRQETFLAPSAKKGLLEYKEWIEEKLGRPVTKSDPLIFSIEERPKFGPLSYERCVNVIRALSKRSKVPFSAHDARRFVENALENAAIHVNRCRKIRGRKVRGEEAPYSQPAIEALRKDFAKALPDLEFQLGEADIAERLKRLEVKERLQSKIERREPFSPEDFEDMTRYDIKLYKRPGEPFTDPEEVKKWFKELRKKPTQDCQKIVAEEELENHLSHGWRFVATLNNGKVVIQRG